MKTIRQLFSFTKNLPRNSGVLAVFLIISTLGWLPSVGCGLFMKEWREFTVFVVIYCLVTLILYLFVGNRFLSKQVKVNTLMVSICIILMTIQNGIIISLYAFGFVPKSSLFIIIPFSLFITLICVETCIYLSNKTKDRKNTLYKRK
jgi:hypothetical protein